MWTLCNTSNSYDIINKASKLLKNNGYIVIAESSRILVPFKKPIQMYFEKEIQIYIHFILVKILSNLLIINNFKPIL